MLYMRKIILWLSYILYRYYSISFYKRSPYRPVVLIHQDLQSIFWFFYLFKLHLKKYMILKQYNN